MAQLDVSTKPRYTDCIVREVPKPELDTNNMNKEDGLCLSKSLTSHLVPERLLTADLEALQGHRGQLPACTLMSQFPYPTLHACNSPT